MFLIQSLSANFQIQSEVCHRCREFCRPLTGIDESIKNNEIFLDERGCEFKTSMPFILKGFKCSVNEFCVDSGNASSYIAKGILFEIRISPVHG